MSKDFLQLFWEVPIIFITLLILTRLQGKKQISHMTYFDYITGITIGDVAAGVISDQSISLSRTILALALLASLSILASYVGERSRKIRKLTEGEPIVVIKGGQILEANLRNMRIDIDHLRMLLRKNGLFTVADVEFAVMETDGSLSVLKKAAEEAVTRKDLSLAIVKRNPSIELIIDGQLDEKKLSEIGWNKDRLFDTLSKNGIKEIKEVSYMEYLDDGKIYIDCYRDEMSKEKPSR
ncbi:DUF421 domain-containing protein [Ammoniphilus sp. YIM 78166]|uniref:DUF421 domain-containing protein n=1 Tax=Ammoniphilus sp. YIM 78166 TaxID=1644106 RepID=UPI00106F3042